MLKKSLSEIPIYYGEVKMPKGFNIDSSILKASILESKFLFNKRCSDNQQFYSYEDLQVEHTQPLQSLYDYLREYIYLNFKIKLINTLVFGNIYSFNEGSNTRNLIDNNNLINSNDYTLLYGIDTNDSCEVRIIYDDLRLKDRLETHKLKTNHFIMFPSKLSYYISKNTQSINNTILTITYQKNNEFK
jgi:hypothetical protein